jgi:cytoskeletal protein CcmA (bactofilin family)
MSLFKTKVPVSLENSAQPTRIEKSTSMEGSIEAQADVRIDGYLKGDVTTTKKVVIGKTGRVIGQVRCQNAEIEGYLEGELTVDDLLSLQASAQLYAQIATAKLSVVEGAVIQGKILMKSPNTLKQVSDESAAEAS